MVQGVQTIAPAGMRPTIAKPMAFPIDVAVLEAWLTTAAPGDELVYAYGTAPARSAAAWVRARELADEGEVRLHQRRRGEGTTIEWFAVRRQPQIDDRSSEPPQQVEDETPEDAVLRILRRYAKLGLDCPTNGAIARELDCTSEQAAYRVRRLKDAGVIRVEQQGFDKPRLVWIVGSKLATRGAQSGAVR